VEDLPAAGGRRQPQGTVGVLTIHNGLLVRSEVVAVT
jgi:hypothetical protein